ncbi:MAG: MBL fold metallo-hydrolase [Moraxellaceae bacterium]|nr:MBL fold metallo-hydrolase [Moraxellaceae bacterium]MDZ4387717.1 MBL fold metallo-hydrolase [Moraxellaceae bacterium]
MKLILRLVMSIVLVLVVALVWSFMPAKLGSTAIELTDVPKAMPPEGMSISALPTGVMKSRAGLAYRGGRFDDERDFAMTAILVRHPKGNLLFDTGFGRNVDEHFKTLPKLMQSTTTYEKAETVASQLQNAGISHREIAGIVLTHAHWDHVSGLDSLPSVPLWVNAAEHEFIESGNEHSALAQSLAPHNFHIYQFVDSPYLGFPRSYDVWGDGSIVLVPAEGHTPGSVLAFITLPSGTRYLLLGDLVWQAEGITLPAERPWLVRAMLGEDAERVRQHIRHVAAIHQRFPEIKLLPAHDAPAMLELPVLPNSRN